MAQYYKDHARSLDHKREYYSRTRIQRREYDKEHHQRNKIKINARKKQRLEERIKETPTLILERELRHKYNLELADYYRYLEFQDHRCAICRHMFVNTITNRDTRVDHDNKTGAVRGLLCHSCNVGLGHFKDNEVRLEAVIRYLKDKNVD